MVDDDLPHEAQRRAGTTVAPNGSTAPDTAMPASRPAGPRDRPFAEGLYLEVMKPLLVALGEWDEPTVIRRFREGYRREEVRLILDGHDAPVGWLQVTEQPDALMLSQIHLIPAARGRGIGTALLRDLLARGTRESRPVILWVLRNNPARRLYERLGFRLVGQEAYKLKMAWMPADGSVSRSNPATAP